MACTEDFNYSDFLENGDIFGASISPTLVIGTHLEAHFNFYSFKSSQGGGGGAPIYLLFLVSSFIYFICSKFKEKNLMDTMYKKYNTVKNVAVQQLII